MMLDVNHPYLCFTEMIPVNAWYKLFVSTGQFFLWLEIQMMAQLLQHV